MTSIYGQGFDNLVERWTWVENEHDRMHPDRGDCGGVGQCPMMAAAHDLETRMTEELEKFRAAPKVKVHSPVKLPTVTDQVARFRTVTEQIARFREQRSLALYAVLTTLDGWIEGQHDNHEACGHRGESTGSECWRTFTPSDFRNMINDAAREVDVTEFPLPNTGPEDMYL